MKKWQVPDITEQDVDIIKWALRELRDSMNRNKFEYPSWCASRVLAIIEGEAIPQPPQKQPCRPNRAKVLQPLKDVPEWAIAMIQKRKPIHVKE